MCMRGIRCLLVFFACVLCVASVMKAEDGGVPKKESETGQPAATETVKPENAKPQERFYEHKKILYKYFYQEPVAGLQSSAPILIYVHGAGAKEEEGMRFHDLRKLLHEWGWLFVSIREYEFSGLLVHLKEQYGERKIFVVGLSAGGKQTYLETKKNPERYAGVILMCPAMHDVGVISKESFPMPVYMICGDLDKAYAKACRLIQDKITNFEGKVEYIEIPGGNHGAPCRMIVWADALRFIGGAPVESKPETAPAATPPAAPAQ